MRRTPRQKNLFPNKHGQTLALLVLWALVAAMRAAATGEFLLQTWDTSSGLPQSTVRCIVQAPDGYLWLGTENGLSRFDGVRFVNFLPENNPALANPNVEALCLDTRGSLWVSALGHVAEWNGRSLVAVEWPLAVNDRLDRLLISRADEIIFSTIQGCLVQGRLATAGNWQWTSSRPAGYSQIAVGKATNDIWQLTLSGRLWRVADLQRRPVTVPAEAGRLNLLVNDAAGRVWLGAEHQLLVNEAGKFRALTPPAGQKEFSVASLVPTSDGALWVMANDHLWKLKGDRWVLDAGAWPARMPPLRLLAEDRDGNVWFSQFGSGLIRLDRDGRVLTLTMRDGLTGDRVRCLTQDREGNLWIGVDRGGLVRLTEKKFQVLGTGEGLSDAVVLSVCEDQSGAIWAGTYGGGLGEWTGRSFTNFNFGVDGSRGYVFAMLPDHEGRLWVGTRDNGVFVREAGEFKRFFSTNALPGSIRAIFESRDHAIWFGTSAGLYRWQNNNLEPVAADTELAQADVRWFVEDTGGALWVGTQGNGLHRFKDGAHTALHVADGLPNESIRSLFADEDGSVWIGSYGGGLFQWKNGRLARAMPAADLPDNVINNIQDDAQGRLWISTGHGLFRIAKSDLNAFAAGAQKNVPCIAYGKFDGLPTVDFSGGVQPCGWRARDGRLWFATSKGLVSFDPTAITVNPLPPPVVVENLLVNDKLFAASRDRGPEVKDLRAPLQIPPGRTRFEFHFTGLSFIAPDKVNFQYRLNGLENEWIDAGVERSVAYSYLPPGKYQFCVRAANNDGIWNETGAAVSFQVLPHFWQRWWFRAFVALLIIGLVWFAYFVRMARLRELERLRLRIARDLHDDVGANLASMALIAEAMEKQPAFGDPADLRRIALHTIDALRDIVWFIDPARDRLGDLVARMRDTAPLLLTGIKYDFEAILPNPELHLPPAFRRNVFPIFKEALHNAASHARAGHVKIILDCRAGALQLQVNDDGIGFDEQKIIPGNGLRNLRRRAAEMHGSVRIQSATGQGTLMAFAAPFPRTRGFRFRSNPLNSHGTS
jgi:ligand-binding sensor domain-containing protein/signal transduction histidine kinase